jgi:exodeoxyribonuclease V alpha subunit
MVDLPLMRAILRALPEEAALCPGRRRRSAAIGRTEASTRRLGAVSVVRSTAIFRRAPESRIVTNAHRSPRVRCPILARSTAATSIFRCGRCSGGVRRLLAIVRERIPKHFGLDPSRDVKMLCAEPRRPAARSLNTELQNALKPTWPDPHRAVRLDLLSRPTRVCRSRTTTTARSTTVTSLSCHTLYSPSRRRI